jgi:fumarate reductase subunit D
MSESIVRREGGTRSYLMGLMSYMGILCFVPLIMNKDDEFVNFHAKQGLVIWIWSILGIMALYVPGIGRLFFSATAMGVVVISIVGVVSVLLSRAWKLPGIYNLASKF